MKQREREREEKKKKPKTTMVDMVKNQVRMIGKFAWCQRISFYLIETVSLNIIQCLFMFIRAWCRERFHSLFVLIHVYSCVVSGTVSFVIRAYSCLFVRGVGNGFIRYSCLFLFIRAWVSGTVSCLFVRLLLIY